MTHNSGSRSKENVDPEIWSEVKDQAFVVETRIAHEINLLGQRTTWLVMSQAFLFAAWVQLAIHQDPPGTSTPSKIDILFYVIPCIGLGVSIAATFSIWAAMRMIDARIIDRVVIDKVLGLTEMGPNRKESWTRLAGHAPTEILPPLFVVAWSAVLVQKVSSWPNDTILMDSGIVLGIWLGVRLAYTLHGHWRARIKAGHLVAEAVQRRRAMAAATPPAGSSGAVGVDSAA